MFLTAIAVDDEPQALTVLQLLATKVPFLQLKGIFTNAFEAIAFLQQHKVDLLFVDIQMPDLSGIDLVRSLSQTPMVIFTTAYSDYAVQGFDLDATDYLLKPFSLVRFIRACNKALEQKSLRSADTEPYLFLKTGYEEEKVLLNNILYIEAEGNYLMVVLPNRRLLTRQTMTELLLVLPSDQFARVHRSYVVAIHKIEKITRYELVIADHTIPMGASYEEKVAEIRLRLRGH